MKRDLFLDSGAFSAFSSGGKIELENYCNFISKEVSEMDIHVYANLDVIGDPEATYKNQKYMESKGLKPLPVFHTPFEDPDIWLKKYIDDGYDYIGFGGMGSRTVSRIDLVRKLDYCFDKYICDKDGYPKIKTHGFAITSTNLVMRYPWYSVDSTAYRKRAVYGKLLVPKMSFGSFDYLQTPYNLMIGEMSPYQKNFRGHFKSLNPSEKEMVIEYVKYIGFKLGKTETTTSGEVEITEKGVTNDDNIRTQANMLYFLELEKCINQSSRRFEREGASFLL